MTTTKQLGRFLFDNQLRMKVDLSKRAGFVVTLEKLGEVSRDGKRRAVHEYDGKGETFPDAVDAALRHYARWGFAPETSS